MVRAGERYPDEPAGRTRVVPDGRPRALRPDGPRAVAGALRRRWPWAVAAAVAGSLTGAVAAYALRRLRPPDAPDAQDPEDLQAVVDRARPVASDGSAPGPRPAP